MILTQPLMSDIKTLSDTCGKHSKKPSWWSAFHFFPDNAAAMENIQYKYQIIQLEHIYAKIQEYQMTTTETRLTKMTTRSVELKLQISRQVMQFSS